MIKVLSKELFFCFLFSILVPAVQAQTTDSIPKSDSSSSVVVGETKYFAQLPPVETEKTSEDLMKEAIVHFDGGRYQKSLESLDQAIEINEFDQLEDILYYYRAVSKAKLGDNEGAAEDYSHAIKANPYKSKYVYHRGLSYFQLKQYDLAKKDFQASLAMDGENADIYVKLAFLKQQENDLRGAIADYTKAIELNPKFAEPYYYRGLIYLQVLMHDKACLDLKKAADLGHRLALRHYDKYCDDYR